MPMPRTLYIIADGVRARYIERIGPGRFRTFRDLDGAHKPERSPAPARNRSSEIETAILRSIVEDLRVNERLGGFDNLVLAAPVRLQKILLAALTPALKKKLAGCINKNLAKVPDSDLYSHLPVFLAPATSHPNLEITHVPRENKQESEQAVS